MLRKLLFILLPGVFLCVSATAFAQTRTWTDDTGKHRVVATFLDFDGTQVQIKKEDGRVVTLPLDKLSQADVDFAKSQKKASDNPFAGGEISTTTAKASSDKQPTIRVGDLKSAKKVFIGDIPSKWSYQPPKLEPSSSEQNFRVCQISSTGRAYPSVEDMFFAKVPEGLAFVATKNGHGDEATTTITVCRLSEGKTAVCRLNHEVEFWGPSPNGKFFMTTPSAQRDDTTKAKIDIYQVGTDGAKLATCFVPYGSAKDDSDRKIKWAGWVNDRYIMTIAGFSSSLCLWDLKTGKAIYTMPITGSPPKFSPDGKVMCIVSEIGVTLNETMTGNALGKLSDEESIIADFDISPDGTRLLGTIQKSSRKREMGRRMSSDEFMPQSVTIWDLTSGQEIKEMSVDKNIDDPFWLDSQTIMKEHTLYDVTTGIPLCTYHGSRSSKDGSFAGRYWYFISAGKDQLALASAKLPHPAAVQALKKINPADQFVLYPESSVELVVETNGLTDADAIRQSLEKRLASMKIKISPQANVKLVARVQKGNEEEVGYSSGGFFSPISGTHVKVKVQTYISEMQILVGGNAIWNQKRVSVPDSLPIKTDQSLEAAASELSKPDVEFFERAWIPQYLSQNARGNALTEAELTATGVRK